MTREQFIESNSKEELSGLTPEYVYDTYESKIKPYLAVISHWLNKEKPATEKQLKLVLGVSGVVWNVCKSKFNEFFEVLLEQESYMELKAQYDLEKAIELAPENAKLIELQMKRFDSGYTKDKGVEINMPVIRIEEFDSSISEEEISEKFDD
jgi:hypothetical protein